MGMHRISIDLFDETIRAVVAEYVTQISHEAKRRSFLAANELKTASAEVLAGERSGRIYRIPETKKRYQASAPGEAPASRLNDLRKSWLPQSHAEQRGKALMLKAEIASNIPYADYLEHGTKNENGEWRIKPRPYHNAIRAKAIPRVKAIYKRRYFH